MAQWNNHNNRMVEASVCARRQSRVLNRRPTNLNSSLRDSVSEQLVSDVPLGVWASGGLDSSTLLHYASEIASKPIQTFSISFESKSCDESEYFRQVAQLYGTEHHEFELRPGPDVVSAIEDFAYLLGRAWRRRGSTAGSVSFENDPETRDGGSLVEAAMSCSAGI